MFSSQFIITHRTISLDSKVSLLITIINIQTSIKQYLFISISISISHKSQILALSLFKRYITLWVANTYKSHLHKSTDPTQRPERDRSLHAVPFIPRQIWFQTRTIPESLKRDPGTILN